jgi:hypothetical protein
MVVKSKANFIDRCAWSNLIASTAKTRRNWTLPQCKYISMHIGCRHAKRINVEPTRDRVGSMTNLAE